MFRPSFPSDAILADRYQVIHSLGHGGMATVYLARDLRFTHRRVALKENADKSSTAQAQFRLEAEVLAALRHPNLPAVTDHFITPDGHPFLVMDYIDGETLEEQVRREGPLPESRVIAWADQVLDALAYLHTQSPPIIHRDVKPSNIRITPEGRAVLVDFGVAKYMVPGQQTSSVARAGSPGYAPIEQYAGGTDQRSDFYSLGATLYFALTGKPPPESPLLASGQTLPMPRRINPTISARAEAVIVRAMQTDATQRFRSAVEMRSALCTKREQTHQDLQKWQKATLAGLILFVALVLFGLISWVTYRALTELQSLSTPAHAPQPKVTTIATSPLKATVMPEYTRTPRSPTVTQIPTAMPRPTSTFIPMSTNTPYPVSCREVCDTCTREVRDPSTGEVKTETFPCNCREECY